MIDVGTEEGGAVMKKEGRGGRETGRVKREEDIRRFSPYSMNIPDLHPIQHRISIHQHHPY